MKRRNAVIAGAGVAGLAAAFWLTRNGWSVRLLEKAPSLRFGGHLMGLSGPGYKALEEMNIFEQLQPFARQACENICLDRNGQEILRLKHTDLIGDMPFVMIRRSDLVQVLAGLVEDNSPIEFGTSVMSFEETEDRIAVHLSDGSAAEADLLIGADGMRSRLRTLMFPGQTMATESLGYRFALFETQHEDASQTILKSYIAPGHMAEVYGITPSRTLTLLVWNSPDSGKLDPRHAPTHLKEAFSCVHPLINRLISKAEADGETFVVDTLSMTVLPTWSASRAVLLGDAAHALSLVSGQGAGMALTGAKILADKLRDHAPKDAVLLYEQQMRPAIDSLQARSRKLARWYVPQSTSAFKRRNLMLKVLPKWLLRYQYQRSMKAEWVL